MSASRKIPQRQCVGCRTMRDKKELLRVVCSSEGVIAFDTAGRMPGRGAYLCRNAECLKRARKARALERAFSRAVGDEVYEALEKESELYG